ncbi:MAG: hypothetical protein KGH63_05035, partial [Candidatus Micrarchaeota archaeon]|nr:hypothetical protein [Candidatus Micrarchaeota archaeon]
YPKDYPAALAAVLGLSIAQVSDPAVLDERIAFEVARCGSWSLALRVWQEITRHQKMRSARAAAEDPVTQGMVPPDAKAGRRWWGLAPNWGGLNFGSALRALAKMIFAS